MSRAFERRFAGARGVVLIAAVSSACVQASAEVRAQSGTAAATVTQAAPQVPARPASKPLAKRPAADEKQRTRFVTALEKPVAYKVFTLDNPYRVVIDLPDVKFQLPPQPAGQPKGLISYFRGGLLGPGQVRVVLETTGPVLVERSFIEKPQGANPARLIVDVVPTDEQTFKVGQSIRPALTTGKASMLGGPITGAIEGAKRAVAKRVKPVIVIDPGHGGHDSGAKKNGAVEKEVVLAFSLALRDKLVATGRYEVLMTRDTDRFVELSERREFARRNNAALFIAVHADYIANSTTRGATIYSLKGTKAEEISRSFTGNRNGDVMEGVPVERIKKVEENPEALKAIFQDLHARADQSENRPAAAKTAGFVTNVIDRMGRSTEVKPDAHRSANFAVLRASDMPSVLIELAYVTNQQDAANLKSESWRDRVSGSLLQAVDNYFKLAKLPL